MKLEAVTVCVGYADFLAAVVPWNVHHFDHWVVVTSPKDGETKGLCRKWGLHCLVTDDGARGGDDFAKGRMIERGLHHLSKDAWRLHLDADIALPTMLHHVLESAHLDEGKIYGVDRVMVKSWCEWQKLLGTGWLQSQRAGHIVAPPPGFPVGARWVNPTTGWVPIGYWQLWHSSQDEVGGLRVKGYPSNHGTACRTDVQHALQWDRRHRELLPELFVAHLESEPCKTGANWNGRTTRRFGPPPVQNPLTCS